MEEYYINPGYFKRKPDYLEGKSIDFISSLAFRGRCAEVDCLKERTADRYQVTRSQEKAGIAEGILATEDGDRLTAEDAIGLIRSFPYLKWTFFFVCAPFREKDDPDKKLLCVGYSGSGAVGMDRFRVIGDCDSAEEIQWITGKSVITSRHGDYRYPFAGEWKQNLYYREEDGRIKVLMPDKGSFLVQTEDNQDLYQSYRRNMARFKSAMEAKFYYEAMLIDYALLEDITHEFLYHIGLFEKQNQPAHNKKVEKKLLAILGYDMTQVTTLKTGTISSKVGILRGLAEWVCGENNYDSNDRYQCALRRAMEGTDPQCILDTCDHISWWLKYRNEIMHAMLKRNPYSMDAEISAIALEGKEYFDLLKKQKDAIKKENLRKIRNR